MHHDAKEILSSDKLSNGSEFSPKNHAVNVWLNIVNLCDQSMWVILVTYDFILKKEPHFLCVNSESAQLFRVLVSRYSCVSVKVIRGYRYRLDFIVAIYGFHYQESTARLIMCPLFSRG